MSSSAESVADAPDVLPHARGFLLGFALAALLGTLFRSSTPLRLLTRPCPSDASLSAVAEASLSAAPPRNVYFDIGANNGDSITAFLASRDIFYDVVLVEANPAFTPVLTALCAAVVADGRARSCDALTSTALTTFDGFVELFAETSSDWGGASSIVPTSNIVRGPGARVNTTARDVLTLFASRRKGPRDHWAVKIDIEGAEFDVLPRALFAGTCALWDEVSVEWHDGNSWVFGSPGQPDAAKSAVRAQIQALWRMNGLVDGVWTRRRALAAAGARAAPRGVRG